MSEKTDFLQDMTPEQREKSLKKRIKHRIEVIRMSSNKDHLMKYYEEEAIFHNKIWQVIKALKEKGKL